MGALSALHYLVGVRMRQALTPAEFMLWKTIRSNYDEARATVLHGYGYRVLHFRNEEITSDLPAVLDRITAEVGVHDNC